MAVYPAHRSALVIRPTKISESDLRELKAEINKNPLWVLDYLVEHKCPFFEDASFTIPDKKFAGYYSDGAKTFVFYNCLKNTADVVRDLGLPYSKNNNAKVIEFDDRKAFTSLRTKNDQFRLFVSDTKYTNFVRDLSKEEKEAPMGAKEIKGRGLTKQILVAINKRMFASSIIDNDDVEDALKEFGWKNGENYKTSSISSSLEVLRRDGMIDKTDRRGKWKIRNYPDASVVVPVSPAAVPVMVEVPITKSMTGHSVAVDSSLSAEQIQSLLNSNLDKDTKLKILTSLVH